MNNSKSKKITDKELKRLSHEHGKAYEKALDGLRTKEIDHAHAETDDFIVSVMFEKAEGWYELKEGKLEWREPLEHENLHVEVIVQDKEFGFFIPQLEITCRLETEEGNIVDEKQQRFIWHPYVLHYGEDWHIPGEGKYMAEVTIKQPAFRRHKKDLGKRYLHDTSVRLGLFDLKPGAKK